MARTFVSMIHEANMELIVKGNLDAIADYFAPDYVAHVTGRELSGGHEVVRKIVRAYRRAFSDLTIEIDILVKSKTRIAWQRTLTAQHTGPFQGFPATNRPIRWRDMITSEVRDGLIGVDWVVTDLAEQLLLVRKGR